MSDEMPSSGSAQAEGRRHPEVSSVEDVIAFKLNRLVGINELAGQRWSKTLFDLSLNEWRMLALVQSNPALRAGDLAELMLMDKSQLSRLSRALIEKQLIKSMPDNEDARAIVLGITSKGQMLYEEILVEVLSANERVLAVLSAEEVLVFDGLLDRLIQHSSELLEARLRAES